MILVTVVRVSGIKTLSGQLDTLWEDYWNIVSAEVGLIMTSATAFRTLYVSTTASLAHKNQKPRATPGSNEPWISTFLRSSRRLLTRVTNPRTWISSRTTTGISNKSYEFTEGGSNSSIDRKGAHRVELNTLPRAHMTGIRTAVNNSGRTRQSISAAGIMQSHWEEEGEEQRVQEWPLGQNNQEHGYAFNTHSRRQDSQNPAHEEFV